MLIMTASSLDVLPPPLAMPMDFNDKSDRDVTILESGHSYVFELTAEVLLVKERRRFIPVTEFMHTDDRLVSILFKKIKKAFLWDKKLKTPYDEG